ncbi:DoxX family protein [Massilia sp. GCM10020059]|uniref:DoxX family protein n=1 Tax=Massilia agrisoli TaxID=2892444 RepID=A0ABS8IN23_9BURK|nr:DoxX family protein [Massilia agrisoli]MCC6069995.1 DoxX family protein [Massilia agrisoli]
MNNASNKFYPIGRALVGVLFAVSGINKILGFSYVAGWMASSGLPMASLLLALTIVLEVGGGLLLISGIQAGLAAAALALFLVPVTAIFHAFWSADAAGFQGQLTHFLKNVAVFGGLLMVWGAERLRSADTGKRAGSLGRSAV